MPASGMESPWVENAFERNLSRMWSSPGSSVAANVFGGNNNYWSSVGCMAL